MTAPRPVAGWAQAARVAAVAAVALALGALGGCETEAPARHVRVVAASPSGAGVAPEDVRGEVAFTGPVSAEGLVDGRRLVLVPAEAARAALEAVESDAGAAGLAAAVPGAVTLEDGGARAVLRVAAALRPYTAYALVLSSRARAAAGGAVLDAAGKQRPTVATFETGAAAGPPPRPVLTEVLADAATPEAGGEYAELVNLGEGPLDPAGWRLGKRTTTGALASCALAGPPVPPWGVGVVVGGAWDGRYGVPGDAVLLGCGGAALLGGIANDRGPALVLIDPTGAVATTLGDGGGAPVCGAEVAMVRVDLEAEDAPGNLACADPSPGWW